MGIRLTPILIFLIAIDLEARPISYSGASTLMAFSDTMKNSIYYHYSPTYKYSLGVELVRDKVQKKEYAFFRFTSLLNRKNTKRSQRNLYFQSGISFDESRNRFYGIHGDWETRRWYTGFNYKKINTGAIIYTDQSYQFGVAPYVGEYGDLHSWVMIKTRKNFLESDWSTYPVLKFFKGNALIELGYSKQSHWDAHLMYRF